MSESNPPPANPVFVVGVFRSGTSLLYSLLNQHPQIALMYECDVWDFPGAASRQRFAGNWLERQEFYNQALSRHRLIFGGRLNGLENIQAPDDLYRCHRDAKDALLCGEKAPGYATRLAQLSRQYPGAWFILIWRDPVEVYRSILKAGQTTPFFRRPGMLHRLIFHQEKIEGFWLTEWFKEKTPLQKFLFANKVQKLLSTELKTHIQGRFPLQKYPEAIEFYKKNRSDGKVLLTPA